MTDQIIKEKILNLNYKKSNIIYFHLNEEEKKYIDNRYNDSESLSETIYRLLNNINVKPTCKTCGNKVKFINYSAGFREYCSIKCQSNNKELNIKRKKTNLKKYGVDNIFKSLEFRNKIKENNIKNYGVEYSSQREDIKQKISKSHKNKSQDEKQEILNKRKQTNLEKYGYENVAQSLEVKEKIKNTFLEKYGCENALQSLEVKEKIKETFIKKYGVSNPNKTKIVRDKIKQTCLEKYGVEHHWLNPEIKEKRHQTWLNKYGVDICSQAESVKEKMSKTVQEKYGVKWFTQSKKLIEAANTDEVKDKEFKTKIKNMSFSKSKEEDKIYELLLNKFKIVKRQYKDKNLYPFYCDFYLPLENIWIEYNGSQYHNNRPFLNNDKDLEELNLLYELSTKRKQKTGKSKSIYDSMIYTWSDLDVRKRNTAKQNNLYYIELWNMNDAINWINNYNI